MVELLPTSSELELKPGAIPGITIGIGPYEDTLCRHDAGRDLKYKLNTSTRRGNRTNKPL